MAPKGMLKSKTVQFNSVAGLVYIADLIFPGLNIPPGVFEAVLIIGNFLLRLVTKQAIKGLK